MNTTLALITAIAMSVSVPTLAAEQKKDILGFLTGMTVEQVNGRLAEYHKQMISEGRNFGKVDSPPKIGDGVQCDPLRNVCNIGKQIEGCTDAGPKCRDGDTIQFLFTRSIKPPLVGAIIYKFRSASSLEDATANVSSQFGSQPVAFRSSPSCLDSYCADWNTKDGLELTLAQLIAQCAAPGQPLSQASEKNCIVHSFTLSIGNAKIIQADKEDFEAKQRAVNPSPRF